MLVCVLFSVNGTQIRPCLNCKNATYLGERLSLVHVHSSHSLWAKWVLPGSSLNRTWRSRQLLQVSITVLLLPSSPCTWCLRRGEGLHKGTLSLAHVTERGAKPSWAAGSFLCLTSEWSVVCLRGAEELCFPPQQHH